MSSVDSLVPQMVHSMDYSKAVQSANTLETHLGHPLELHSVLKMLGAQSERSMGMRWVHPTGLKLAVLMAPLRETQLDRLLDQAKGKL